jgi:hypothetical protein
MQAILLCKTIIKNEDAQGIRIGPVHWYRVHLKGNRAVEVASGALGRGNKGVTTADYYAPI